MDEKGEKTPKVRDFGAGFNLSNQAIQNDRHDLLAQAGERMVRGCIERFRRVLLEPLQANAGAGQTMADGQPMFTVARGNLAATGAALNVTSLSAARLALRKQKGSQGEIYAIEPWALVVPAEKETEAQQVLAAIQATKFSEANPFSQALEIIVEPGLSNPLAWYLIGNPALHDGLAHAFLDGMRTPRVETRPAWETLGLQMRVVWALDARFIETASWFRNPGA
ncbi:Mu-like prophage major head subunit gpT family protein [Cereibacter sphaeroides]|uniref:phage major capsid protein n=1 Tax=Cereibacter sphaeroides TaxID=1063 RepID=UPI001F18EF6A|nr:Mu-like prophage major head subunit gpT family protein [Cereibacter sphaeroides]MCE6952400.1 Mu-like prophage major head subunit gpT family protein [Cereibacter sphaeroides]